MTSKGKMDDLPMLPFEKILSYLSLEDRIRSRVVSRRWCKWIDSSRVNSLFYSNRPSGSIEESARLVSGAYVHNFTSSIGFDSFFVPFSQSILSSLKRLRLCDLPEWAASECSRWSRIGFPFLGRKSIETRQWDTVLGTARLFRNRECFSRIRDARYEQIYRFFLEWS